MIDPQRLLELEATARHAYTGVQSRLYALSVGFGDDPMSVAELPFVGGARECKAVPTMATIFGDVILELTSACRLSRPELALHAEQRLEMLAALEAADELTVTGRVTAVHDRGSKGALIHMTAEALRRSDATPVYRATYVTLARGDGGFGGDPPPSPAAPAHGPVAGPPEATWRYRTRPDQALLYSLNGDPNPIHLDPSIARQAGFERPILHGLCTYGIACRALLATACNHQPSRLRRLDARFTAPVVPGDTLAVDLWCAGDEVRFAVRAEERDVVVLKNGYCLLTAAGTDGAGRTPREQ
jgi:acyl dehydratase